MYPCTTMRIRGMEQVEELNSLPASGHGSQKEARKGAPRVREGKDSSTPKATRIMTATSVRI
jgi:hypothetical protein